MINLQVIGNVGKMPETRMVRSEANLSFSVAINKGVKQAAGTWQDETTWINIMVREDTPSAKHIKPGAKLFISGSQSIQLYEGRISQTIWADTVEVIMYAKRDRDEESYTTPRNTPTPQVMEKGSEHPKAEDNPDDLPF